MAAKRGTRTVRDADRLRAALLGAAERIVTEEGHEALTARRLAQEAGCAVGTLYNLFDHLDAVVRAVNLTTLEMLRLRLEAALAPVADGPPERRLIALAETYFDLALEHPNRWAALFRRVSNRAEDPRVEAARDRLVTLLAQAAGQDGGAEGPALRALWAAIHGVTEFAAREHIAGVPAEEVRAYPALIVRVALRGFAALEAEGAAR